jgi:hypothetical protein
MSNGARVLLIGSGIWYLGEGLLGPLIAFFTQNIGGSVLDLSWAVATYLVIYGLLSILFGKISDTKLDKAKLMVWGYALNALFTFGYLLVTDSTTLLIVQAGLGLAAAMATPTWDALFDEFTDSSVDGTSWGIASGMESIITGFTLVVGALVVTYASFKILFLAMGCIQVLATVYQAKILYLKKA